MEVKPGYKQTEVGIIPEEWESTIVGDVATFSGGSQPPRSTFKFAPTRGYVRLIQIRDYKTDDYISFIPESMARKRCTAEDIMIGRYGPPIFQILRGIEGAYNVALIKAIPNQKISREFFFYVLSQQKLFELIDALSQRSSGQTGVEMPALKAYGLPLPPLAEQRTIAAALGDVDADLSVLDRLISKKRDIKQAVMQQLLTGQSRFAGFQSKWQVRPLRSEIADLEAGVSVNSLEDDAESGSHRPAILKTSAVAGGRFIPSESKAISPKDLRRVKLSPRAESIIISRMNTIDLVGECGYANIADELESAGYSAPDTSHIKRQLRQYVDVREIIRRASGESLDLKAYEADMRHLIDTYIEADEPRKISPFDNMSLLDLIVKTGIANAIATQLDGLKGDRNAIAEAIENNVRRKIVKEHLNDPAYYEKMSTLLDEIIALRKAKAIEYEAYLQRIAELAKNVEAGHAGDAPEKLDTPGKRALYSNLSQNEDLALRIDDVVRRTRHDDWRGHQAREQVIKAALYEILKDKDEVERIFLIVKAQREY